MKRVRGNDLMAHSHLKIYEMMSICAPTEHSCFGLCIITVIYNILLFINT